MTVNGEGNSEFAQNFLHSFRHWEQIIPVYKNKKIKRRKETFYEHFFFAIPLVRGLFTIAKAIENSGRSLLTTFKERKT